MFKYVINFFFYEKNKPGIILFCSTTFCICLFCTLQHEQVSNGIQISVSLKCKEYFVFVLQDLDVVEAIRKWAGKMTRWFNRWCVV